MTGPLRTVLAVLLADARRHRLQTATTLVGVAVGVAVVVAIHLSSTAALSSFEQTYGALAGAATHHVSGAGPLSASRLPALLAAPGVRAVQPVIDEIIVLPDRTEPPRTLRLLGIDPFLAAPFAGRLDLTGGDSAPAPGVPSFFDRFMTEPGFALLHPDDLARLGLPPGGALTVAGPSGASTLRCEVLDLGWGASGTGQPLALVDLATAQEILDLGDGVLRFDLILDENESATAGIVLAPGERLERPQRRGDRARTLTRAFRTNLLALGFLAVLVGAFLVFNMAQFAVTRRRPLFGRLRCLGCSARTLLAGVLLEAAVLGVIGGVLGALGGWLLSHALVGDVTQTVSMLYGNTSTATPRLDLLTVAGALLLSTLSCLVATWPPARSAARTPPALVAGAAMHEPLVRVRTPLLFLTASVLLLLPEAGGLVLPIPAVLCLLLGVATLVPLLLGAVVSRTPRSMVLSLAAGRLQRSLARTGATAGALVMPIAMTIGIVLMVGSFEREMDEWVDATVGADVYVAPLFQQLTPQTARLDDELVDALTDWPGVRRVDLLRSVEERRGDASFLVAGARLSALRERGELRLLQGEDVGLYERVAAGEVLVSEPLHRKTGLVPGDTIALSGRAGEEHLLVAAVFQDFSYDRGYVLMDEARHMALYGDRGVRNAALLLAPDATANDVAAGLSARFPNATFTTLTEMRGNIMAAFDRTFEITYVLQAISTTLALIGVLTGLLCLHLERRHELAVLRALGSSGRTVRQLLVVEALVLVGLDAIVAVPFGCALGWILIAVVNTRSFGWSFPMVVAWDDVALVLALAVGAALLAALVPWLMVRRARIAELLAGTAALPLLAALVLGGAAAAQVDPASSTPQAATPLGERVSGGDGSDHLDADGFLQAHPGRPIVLPADHASHPATRTEWWYLTGSVTGPDGELFGFQATWFRRGLVADPPVRTSPLGARDVLLFHGALLDVGNRAHAASERACRAYAPWARADTDRLHLDLLGQRLVAADDDADTATLSFEVDGARLELQLDLGGTAPLLHGSEPGHSRKGDEPGQASWYYSLPRIKTTGTLHRPGAPPLPVRGTTWMDHEFGSSVLSPQQQGWDWFSVALDDGSDLMLFELRLSDGGVDPVSSGTLRRPDGTALHLPRKAFVLTPTGTWTSPDSNARYPSGWTLEIPGQQLALKITPVVAGQEMHGLDTTGVTYWEGLCEFAGTHRGRPVSGRGFVELTGYTGTAMGERF